MAGSAHSRTRWRYRLVLQNATVPAALVDDRAAGARTATGSSLVDICHRRRQVSRRIAKPRSRRPRLDLGPLSAGWCCRASSIATPTSTRATSGRARRTPTARFLSALDAVGRDRVARWSAEDVERRMDFSLRCAYAHGTAALRTHLDSLPPQETISWPVFEEMRERWAGRIELQARLPRHHRAGARPTHGSRRSPTASPPRGACSAASPSWCPTSTRCSTTLCARRPSAGSTSTSMPTRPPIPLAVSLDRIADAVLRNRFEGRVLVGHCCSLARQADDVARRTLDKVAKAGISVVSLPMCNIYLQDRRTDGTTPRWRGVTLLHEMKARGIKVAIASDNTRDPFYAYGDLDMLEVLPRGDAHPPSRPSGRRLAGRRRRDAGRDHGARELRAASRPARRPTSSSSAAARGPSFCRGRNPTASSIRERPRDRARRCPTIRELDDLMVALHDRHRRAEDGARRPQDRGQSGDREAEEPRLLLVFAGAEAPARPRHRRPRRLAEERGGGHPRARRPATGSACRSRRAAPAPAITARRCRSPAAWC